MYTTLTSTGTGLGIGVIPDFWDNSGFGGNTVFGGISGFGGIPGFGNNSVSGNNTGFGGISGFGVTLPPQGLTSGLLHEGLPTSPLFQGSKYTGNLAPPVDRPEVEPASFQVPETPLSGTSAPPLEDLPASPLRPTNTQAPDIRTHPIESAPHPRTPPVKTPSSTFNTPTNSMTLVPGSSTNAGMLLQVPPFELQRPLPEPSNDSIPQPSIVMATRGAKPDIDFGAPPTPPLPTAIFATAPMKPVVANPIPPSRLPGDYYDPMKEQPFGKTPNHVGSSPFSQLDGAFDTPQSGSTAPPAQGIGTAGPVNDPFMPKVNTLPSFGSGSIADMQGRSLAMNCTSLNPFAPTFNMPGAGKIPGAGENPYTDRKSDAGDPLGGGHRGGG